MRHEVRYTLEKIEKYLPILEPLVYRKTEPIPPFRYTKLSSPEEAPPVAPDIDDSGWATIGPDTYWGSWMTDFVMRTSFSVPEDWDATGDIALYLPLGDAGDFSHPETLAYIDGVPYAACDRHHQEILLPGEWKDGASHALALHGWTGLGGEFMPKDDGRQLFMQQCSVVSIDQPTRDFIAAVRVASQTAKCLDANDPVRSRLLNALNGSFKALDLREPFGDAFYSSVVKAHDILREGIDRAGAPLDVDVAATGHSHIDVAWLWTLGQTRRKVGRTFHNVLRNMERFPDFHFTQSQPQLYDYMRRDYPELFAAVKDRVNEGRWEVIGGMWVEADCNISGPESLARQFLLGRSFFREHFGPDAESPVLWLPDVFGYSWSLPQLIKLAGLDYFFTIKIGWSQYNRLPYDTFMWQGIDGTQVLTHFSTTPEITDLPAGSSTYNAHATPQQAIGTWRSFQQKELGQELLMSFGYGDGGGGPTREMLENLREMKSFPGLPRMTQKAVGDFFRKLDTDTEGELPLWNGELYLELHRGTYTTQSRTKRGNRKSEFLLHDAEFCASFASVLCDGFTYPAADLKQAWELVCLNQFHDIIPGSSIAPVYAESQEQYAAVRETAERTVNDALNALCGFIDADLVIVNPTSFARRDLAFHKGEGLYCNALRRPDGTSAAVQLTEGGCWIDTGELPPMSLNPFCIVGSDTDTPQSTGNLPPFFVEKENAASTESTGLSVSTGHLENDYVRVELNADGDICRIFDRENNREVLPVGAFANSFQAFEDRPLEWDAWDVFIYYDDKMWLADPATDIRVVEDGPLRATIEIKRRILTSTYTQRISLSFNSSRIDFDTSIDWREKHTLLKTAFPVDVLATEATYEIQWGNVTRPTHRNTSWDWARFETCAQKWVDLSEGGYGVSLMNDCKYGHDINGNVIRLSLLRGPTNPDPEADMGWHRFAYSLFPHEGAWDERTIREAYSLNDPVIVTLGNVADVSSAATGNTASRSLVRVDSPNVVIETVKRAEDDRGIIVRLYESRRSRGTVTLSTCFDIGEAWTTSLIEDDLERLKTDGNRLTFDIKPFRIITFRLVPKA